MRLPQGKIHKLQGKIHKLQGKIHKLQGKIHELQGKIHELQGKIHELQGKIHELQGKIHELQGVFAFFRVKNSKKSFFIEGAISCSYFRLRHSVWRRRKSNNSVFFAAVC